MVATIIDTRDSHRLGFCNIDSENVRELRQRLNAKLIGERIIDAQRCGRPVYEELQKRYHFDSDLFDWASACSGRVPEKIWWTRDNVNEKKIFFGFDSLKMVQMGFVTRRRTFDHDYQWSGKAAPSSQSRFNLTKATPGPLQAVFSRRFACGIVISRPAKKPKPAPRLYDKKHDFGEQAYESELKEKGETKDSENGDERISELFICETPPKDLEDLMPCLCYQLWDSKMSSLSFLSDILGALIQDLEDLVEAAVEHVSLVVCDPQGAAASFA